MSSIMRARSGLMGRGAVSEVIGGSSLELKVAGPSMLGIGCPDRHALPHITPPKTRRPRYALPPARAGSFYGQDVSFAPFDLLGRVVASRPATFGRLDRLTVNHSR